MSRLFESSLTGKISNILVEEESKIKAKFCPRCGKKMNGYPAVSRYDNETEICSDCGTSEAMLNYAGVQCADPHRYDPETGKKLVKECAKPELKESLSDELADFMKDLDPYGYKDAYWQDADGDEELMHKAAVADIENDYTAVNSFLKDVVDYEESTPDMIERAKYFLGELKKQINESDEVTSEDLEKDDKEIKRKSKKEVEDRIAELKLAIEDGVSDEEKAEMEKEIGELENKLTECGKSKAKLLDEGGWNATIKSGAKLREILSDMDEDASPEECQQVLDVLKDCCEEAKALTDDEYYQDGFQSVIDDIEMIYDDEDLCSSNVDWELDGFYDYCDGANLWVSLGESNLDEAHKAEDNQYPPYRFDEEDAEFIRNLIGPGFKVEIRKSSATDAPDGTLDIELDSKWVSGWMSSTRELDQEIDKYFAEKNPELEVHRNNTGMTLWLGEKSKKEGSVNESAEGIAEFWEKFDNGEIKIGDTFANGITLLDANKEKDYILVDRGYEYVAAWAPELSDGNLVWGQGHYFDDKSDAEKYFKHKLEESAKLNEEAFKMNDDDEYFLVEAVEKAMNPVFNAVDNRFDTNIGYDNSFCTNLCEYIEEELENKIVNSHDDEDFDESAKPVNESVTVVTADGSSVNTQDAASVSTDAGCTTVVTDNTTVTICNDAPVEAEFIPAEVVDEPIEEPEEIIPDAPVEEPVDEVPEEPVEDELTEEAEDDGSVVSVKSLSVVKNQGNVFMLTYKDENDAEQYVVCEDFNNETNEGNEAETYSNKEDADKDYFARLDVNTEE